MWMVADDGICSDKTFTSLWYENFSWTISDTTLIKAGKPTTNALASKWNEFQNKVKTYVNGSFTVVTVSSNGTMQPAKFIDAANALSISLTTNTSGAPIYAADFNNLKSALNSEATLLGGNPGE